MLDAEYVKETAESVAGHKLPRWNDLPDLEIYMDQVISLIQRYFSGYPGCDDKGLTSSMVNNYVKQGIIPPPVSKKYNRVHLAYLIIICILKTVMPIPQAGRLISLKLESGDSYEDLFNFFCDYYESTAAEASRAVEDFAARGTGFTDIVFRSALRASSEQTLALGLLGNAESINN